MANATSTVHYCARNTYLATTISYATRLVLAVLLCLVARPAFAETETETPASFVSFNGYTAMTLNLGLGFAAGGDELFTATYTDGSQETLDAGSGVTATVGITLTPWRRGLHSLGAGVDIGIKHESIGGGNVVDFSMALQRFPLVISAHYNRDLSRNVQWTVSAGLQYETSVFLDGRGVAAEVDLRFDNGLGYIAETGLLFGGGRTVIELTLRHTRMSYNSPGLIGAIDASNTGLFCALHWGVSRLLEPQIVSLDD